MGGQPEIPRDEREYLTQVVTSFRETLLSELVRIEVQRPHQEVVRSMFADLLETNPRRIRREMHKFDPLTLRNVLPTIVGTAIARNLVGLALNAANLENRTRPVPFDFVLASRDYDGKFPWKGMYPFGEG